MGDFIRQCKDCNRLFLDTSDFLNHKDFHQKNKNGHQEHNLLISSEKEIKIEII